jgi:hypothetical protein
MRKLFTLTLVALLAVAGAATATLDWAGNAYPNNNAAITTANDQFVVAQVYKGGVTDGAGQGADIAAVLYYTTDIAAQASVAMTYNTDVGNNDEYIGFIPQAALVGAAWVDVTVVFEDLTDATTFEITQDQQGNPPPLRYTITAATPVDVTVHFTICMEGIDNGMLPCVIGNTPEIGNWGSGVIMNNTSGDIWEIDVTFLAGSNPNVEYKYRKNVCQDWESVPNRVFQLPLDGTTSIVRDVDTWDNGPLACGLGSVLDEDKEVCLQVCIPAEMASTGMVCAVGGAPELGDWGLGVTAIDLGGGLYQFCHTYPQGTPFPIVREYKFKKDGCQTWEGVPNRTYTVDNSSPTSQTLTSGWDGAPIECSVVPNEDRSWGALKSMYR